MQDRVRISLTLRPEIVSLLDSKVDGTKLRNRSHAVEQFLKQLLSDTVKQAVIFIGEEEKILADICGMSTLERILEKLKKAGILKIVMYCDDESKQLKKVLTNKKYMKFDVKFVKNKFQGTASALYECKPYLSPEPFLLMYGDIIADIDLFDLQEFHKSHAGIATMVITSVADPLPWGIVRVKRNLITQFFEKGTPESNRDMRLTNLINAGIYIFNPDIFSFLTSQTKSLEADVFPKLIEGRKLYSYLLDGMWFNIGRGNMLEMAKKHCTLDT